MTKPWNRVIDCTFVSVWDGGLEVISPASFDPDSGHVFDIQTAQLSASMLEECQHLEREYIIVGSKEYDVKQDDDDERYVIRTFDVFFTRSGYAQVEAINAQEAKRIADATLTLDDVSWDDDWPATDAQPEESYDQ